VLVAATEADLDELCAVEARASLRPWARGVFAEELTRDFARVMLLRAPGGPIEALLVYWLGEDELQILNIATDPPLRRRGHAARLLEHAIQAARRAAVPRLILEVRRSNEAAQRLYRKYGFRPIGVRASYYAVEHEDALVMSLAL